MRGLKVGKQRVVVVSGSSGLIKLFQVAQSPFVDRFFLAYFEQVLDQQFLVSEMQKVLYAVESFDEIYEAAQEAEERLT